jgi:hypothetical protein
MRFSPSLLCSLFSAVCLVAGCLEKPALAPPDAPPPKEEAKPAVARCETLQDNCKAGKGRHVRIARAKYMIDVPKGWTYALSESATIAQTGDGGAVAAIVGYEADPKDKKVDQLRTQALDELLKSANIELSKKTKVNWHKKGDEEREAAGVKFSLWQMEGSRGSKKGPLLVWHAVTEGSEAIVGVGFVPEDDASKADEVIVQAIDSIAPGTAGGKAGK